LEDDTKEQFIAWLREMADELEKELTVPATIKPKPREGQVTLFD